MAQRRDEAIAGMNTILDDSQGFQNGVEATPETLRKAIDAPKEAQEKMRTANIESIESGCRATSLLLLCD